MAEEEVTALCHILVIGGCGFLGHHIVKAFLDHPSHPTISVISRSPTHNFLEGANYYPCDISDQSALDSIFSTLKPTIVVNTASPLANAGAKASTLTTIKGTSISLSLALKCLSVKHYIYISSASVIAGVPFALVTESNATLVNPSTHHDPYIAAKATADAMVLAANNPPQLYTAVLRPSGIFGEGDTQVIPGLLNGLDQGMARIQLGDGTSNFDFVYVGNVADACVCCAEAMIREEALSLPLPASKRVSGEAFFITNNSPIKFWGFARLVWSLAGDQTPKEKITVVPMWIVMLVAGICEWVIWALSWGSRRPEKFNRSQMSNCSLDRTFCVQKARERLGWEPRIGLEEGARRAVESVMQERKDRVEKKKRK